MTFWDWLDMHWYNPIFFMGFSFWVAERTTNFVYNIRSKFSRKIEGNYPEVLP